MKTDYSYRGVFLIEMLYILRFSPLLQSLGMNMVQFGLFFTLCTIVGGLPPPVGSYLFVTVTVVKTGVTKLIPWMMVMILVDLIVILMVTFIPGFCTWLPDALLGPM